MFSPCPGQQNISDTILHFNILAKGCMPVCTVLCTKCDENARSGDVARTGVAAHHEGPCTPCFKIRAEKPYGDYKCGVCHTKIDRGFDPMRCKEHQALEPVYLCKGITYKYGENHHLCTAHKDKLCALCEECRCFNCEDGIARGRSESEPSGSGSYSDVDSDGERITGRRYVRRKKRTVLACKTCDRHMCTSCKEEHGDSDVQCSKCEEAGYE